MRTLAVVIRLAQRRGQRKHTQQRIERALEVARVGADERDAIRRQDLVEEVGVRSEKRERLLVLRDRLQPGVRRILRAQPLTLSERLECRDVLAIPIERRPQRLDPDFMHVLPPGRSARAHLRDTFQADRR